VGQRDGQCEKACQQVFVLHFQYSG
jgi:hypothetical protein